MRSSATICCLLFAALACSISVTAITGWCEHSREINLGGQTIERTTAETDRECCNKCAARSGCKGSNWCSGNNCDGGVPRGTCDLKTWPDNERPVAWGCSGAPVQEWRSSVAYGLPGFVGDVPACPGSGGGGSVVPPPPLPDDNIPNCPGCIRRNWRGEIVTLSVDSGKMGEGGNHGSPYIRSPEMCAKECGGRKTTLTANAFTFCNEKAGCGSGCLQYEYFKGSAGCSPSENSSDKCFGPFATYGSDDFGGSVRPGCIGDKFRYATCSCKLVRELDEGKLPELVDGDTSWVSGRSPLPEIQPR